MERAKWSGLVKECQTVLFVSSLDDFHKTLVRNAHDAGRVRVWPSSTTRLLATCTPFATRDATSGLLACRACLPVFRPVCSALSSCIPTPYLPVCCTLRVCVCVFAAVGVGSGVLLILLVLPVLLLLRWLLLYGYCYTSSPAPSISLTTPRTKT